MSSHFTNLVVKDVVQCFVLKPTTRKYFSLYKKGFLSAFCCLLNKAKFYERDEVKGKLVAGAETSGYWDPVDMCTFFVYLVFG